MIEDTADDTPCPYVTGNVTRYCTLTPFTLTREEREAVAIAASVCGMKPEGSIAERSAATLRGLLDRTAR